MGHVNLNELKSSLNFTLSQQKIIMDLNVDTLIDRILLSMIVDVQHFDNPHSTI